MLFEFQHKMNKMQEECLLHEGENIIIDAPTGSGKTEGILFNIKKGNRYFYFLPTITSCMFMYRRLRDMKCFNVEIRTSLMSEKYNYDIGDTGNIIVMTPDPIMIQYLSGYNIDIDGFIFDEIDNYPEMVKSAIIDLVENERRFHYIVASATLDEQLLSVFNSFELIKMNTNLKLIKYKTGIVSNHHELVHIIRTNRDKKICLLFNSIAELEDMSQSLERYGDITYMSLHGKLNDHDRQIAEEKLYNGDYNILLSNDIISYSIDVNFDILIMHLSDRLATNIQRMGRCNRYNKNINHTNLYFFNVARDFSYRYLSFIDNQEQYEQYLELSCMKAITYNKINQLRKQLKFDELPTVDFIINEYWKELKENNITLNLRKVPLTFKENVSFVRVVYNGKSNTKKEITINTTKTHKINGEFPWAWRCYDENGDKKYVYISCSKYEIMERNNLGEYIIEKYDGESYSLGDLEDKRRDFFNYIFWRIEDESLSDYEENADIVQIGNLIVNAIENKYHGEDDETEKFISNILKYVERNIKK